MSDPDQQARDHIVEILRHLAFKIESKEEVHLIFGVTLRQPDGQHRSYMHDFGQYVFTDQLTWQLLKHNMFNAFKNMTTEFPKAH